MADPNDKQEDIAIMEEQDGSAVVDLPEKMLQGENFDEKADGGNVRDDDADHPDDDDELVVEHRVNTLQKNWL